MVNTFAGGKSSSDPVVQRMAGLLQRQEAIKVVELGEFFSLYLTAGAHRHR
jgi:hypothetical protein